VATVVSDDFHAAFHGCWTEHQMSTDLLEPHLADQPIYFVRLEAVSLRAAAEF